MKRLTADQYLWSLAFAAAKRGTCDRFEGGCVIARDGILVATGYNGSAPGEPHCSDVGHELVQVYPTFQEEGAPDETEQHCTRTIHAEINAVVNAASLGVSIQHCDWYVTGLPCVGCSRVIARLEPHRMFVCGDRGCVEDDKVALIQWWKKRRTLFGYPDSLFVKTLEELVEQGVVPDSK